MPAIKCLAQRIPDEGTLRQQVAANVLERNAKPLPSNGDSLPKMLAASSLDCILAFQLD